MAPLISCIVPVFNGERYLNEALQSIFAQSYPATEVVVVDDGSSDRSADVVACYNKRVRYLRQNNLGPAATRNLGLSAVRGDFVAFLDQDDLWHPQKLEKQLALFRARPELDICIAHVQLFWVEEIQQEASRLQSHKRGCVVPGYTTGSLLTRRSIFDCLGLFDPSLWFGDATEWFLRANEVGKVIELMPDALLYHRMHPMNLTRRRAEASKDEFLRIIKGMLDRRRAKAAPLGPV